MIFGHNENFRITVLNMKKISITLIILLMCILTLKFVSKPFANSDTIMGRISNILNKNNKIELKCIDFYKKDVSITWKSEDFEQKFIIKNGRKINEMRYDYGPNRFSIQLSNGLIFNVGHFKTNCWHSHRYKFEITKKDDGYKIIFIANGPDYERDELMFDLSGIRNGIVKSFYANGNCSYEGNYKNGLREGSFVYYHRNGKIRVIDNFENDTLRGYTHFDKDGNLERKIKYVNGVKMEDND